MGGRGNWNGADIRISPPLVNQSGRTLTRWIFHGLSSRSLRVHQKIRAKAGAREDSNLGPTPKAFGAALRPLGASIGHRFEAGPARIRTWDQGIMSPLL